MRRPLPARGRFFAVCALLILGGCVTPGTPATDSGNLTTTVVVVPARDGHVGAVVAQAGERQELLDTAYAGAQSDAKGQLRAMEMASTDVNQTFGMALGALPEAPATFLIRFELGSDQLTRESAASFELIAAEVARRPVADIRVEGHTDRQGTESDNLQLSLRRAQRVTAELLQAGFDEAVIRTVGLGETRPLIPTADDVKESRNRRVEIYVR